VLTIIKATLNHAHGEGKVTCHADAWVAVKAFREADKAKVRYLLDDEITMMRSRAWRTPVRLTFVNW
jgi:hypothetical protein